MARDGGGEAAGAGAGVGIDFLGYELLPSYLLSYHIREASESAADTRAPTSHPREGSQAHALARARMHTYTHVDLHVVHTGRLRVGLATGVEIIPDCLER